ncbi:protein-L-isoaspartate O-methyltransferase family protein [Rhodopila sp.]|uniref:protein-L-isoaspartate O-methyltransferase family protein n=1 Tax=Rhodopila sp. TaxID=2480087 RepID=UPI003D0B2C09
MAELEQNDIAAHSGRFIAMLDDAFRRYGAPDGLPARLRDAVAATPRHRFVHHFRVGDGALQDFDASPEQTLGTVYSDQVMRHVDAAGELLPSSNSQPSYVLWLLNLLALEPGQAVLEIGSGSGWLAAVMARLVGSSGKVVGVELIPGLARQSRTDLAKCGIGNVEIICGDGMRGHAISAPYHRAIITAATWDPPAILFEQVMDGGRTLVPIELRDGSGCEVTVLRRQRDVLFGERVVPGRFVPLFGAGQDRAGTCRRLETLPLWSRLSAQPGMRWALPLGALPLGGPAPIAAQFRSFLGRTEPGLVVAATEPDAKWTPWRPAQASLPTPPFGLVDDADGSLALWDAGELLGYGGPSAAERLARAYASWAEFGLPGLGAFALEIHRTDAAPSAARGCWVEQRGATALAWRLRPDAAKWRNLLQGTAQPLDE